MSERTGARPRTVLVLVVASLVLGILGMHALATHAGTSSASGMSGVSGGHAELVAPAPVAALQPAHDGGHDGARDGGHDGGHDGGGHEAMMLCAAMLATAALLLLALLVLVRAPRLVGLRWLSRAPAGLARLCRDARPVATSGPPAVWARSVVRC